MSRLLRAASLFLLASTAVPAMAQSARSDEIKALKEEMAKLAARIAKLEQDERQPEPQVAAPPASSPRPGDLTSAPPSTSAAPFELPAVLVDNPQFELTADDVQALKSRTLASAPLDRSLQPDGAAVELSSTTDATTVAIKLSRSNSTSDGDFGRYMTYGVTASAPLSNSGRFNDIATLDGFIGSSRLRFQLGWYQRRITEPDLHPAYPALVEAVTAACRKRLGETAKDCTPDLFSSQFVHTYAPELETAYLAMGRMTSGPDPRVDWSARAWGLEASIGYKKFNYIEAGPARASEDSRIPFGGKVYFSYLPDVRRNSITWAAEYQRTFKDATAGALCPAPVPGVETTCLIGPVGSPLENEKLLLSAEYRHKWVFDEFGLIPVLGISPMLTYDALNDHFGIDVPIYLVNDAKAGLNGGIRFGYTTKGDDFIAGIFVGTAFSIR